MSATLIWFRRDFRLTDHPALTAAVARGEPVIPVFVFDDMVASLGAAHRWRLEQAVRVFADRLAARGSQLILRRGTAQTVIPQLVAQTGATAVYWSRAYDPASQTRDRAVKAALKDQGIAAQSFKGHLLYEPWTIANKQGSYFKVYTPFWRSASATAPDDMLPVPSKIPAPVTWPVSDQLGDWGMAQDMYRGAGVLAKHARVGEDAAQDRLNWFIDTAVDGYKDKRDFPALDATSQMSENLTFGEISPHRCWWYGVQAERRGAAGAEHFRKELMWREFAYHLLHHSPQMLTENWRTDWDGFPWQSDPDHPHVLAWKQGRTGVPFVDAAMREMYVTGKMHNRARMIVGSYLTKHLLTHWKIGMQWFEDCLTDWDPAANAMGWQWVAGSGPDAAPYFRIFNPETQLAKFDAHGHYSRAWLAHTGSPPSPTALEYYAAIPLSWGMKPTDSYPKPVVPLGEGRQKALFAYQNRGF